MKINKKRGGRKKGKNSYASCGVIVLFPLFFFVLFFHSIAHKMNDGSKPSLIKPASISNDHSQPVKTIAKEKMLNVHPMQPALPTEDNSPALPTEDNFQPVKTIPMEKILDVNTEPKRSKLAFVITITKDGYFGLDGAAVLAYSIIKSFVHHPFDISFVALVHPNVTTSRVGLTKLGFHVVEVPVPINVTAIRFDFLREKINKNGCCGASELIKLTSYRLTQYDRVIHLDADTMILNSFDELFDMRKSLVYTTDPNMATFKGEDKMPVQGGFIVLKPSERDYKNLIDIMMTTEFRKGKGWNSTKVGWYWGGMTVQGLLPYYYNLVTTANRSVIVDRCVYNTMADTEECRYKSLKEIKSAHFTVCQKPWNCEKKVHTKFSSGIKGVEGKWEVNPLCMDLHYRWRDLRREAEELYGVKVVQDACPKGGRKNYIAMDLDKARLPVNLAEHSKFSEGPIELRIVPDDSLGRYNPVEEARYTGVQYD